MQDIKNYLNSGWDFMDETYNGSEDIWGFNSSENDGYPFLCWQGMTNGLECQAPFLTVSGITFGEVLVNSIKLESISNPGYGTSGYSIYINTEDSWIVPTDGVVPISNTLWNNNGQQCVYFGTSGNSDVLVEGLSEETKYYFKIYAYNDCSGIETYEQNGIETSVSTRTLYTAPEGQGSETNPYIIANRENLAWLMYNDLEWDKYYIQTADIDASSSFNWDEGSGFTPIGNLTTAFTGSYNGKGYIIDNIFINRCTDSLIGLFGMTNKAEINNLGLTNVNIKGSIFVGGLVGHFYGGQITNCYTTGNVTGNAYVGGLAGINEGSISFCYSGVNVSYSYDVIGGLVGLNADFISCSYSTGDVTGNNYVGGFVGVNLDFIIHSYSRSSVEANTNYIGGLIGDNYGYTINSFWDIETSGQSTSIGGDGLITADMQNIESYFNAGWDFMDEMTNGSKDYWGLNSNENEGYPFLYWQGYTNTETSTTGINKLKELGVSIYPNPVSEILNISFNDEDINQLIITDVTGKAIVNKIVTSGTEQIDMSGFKSGIYLISMWKGNEVYISKIIKK